MFERMLSAYLLINCSENASSIYRKFFKYTFFGFGPSSSSHFLENLCMNLFYEVVCHLLIFLLQSTCCAESAANCVFEVTFEIKQSDFFIKYIQISRMYRFLSVIMIFPVIFSLSTIM